MIYDTVLFRKSITSYHSSFLHVVLNLSSVLTVYLLSETSYESQTEDDPSPSTEAPNLSSTQPNVHEEADFTESAEEEERHNIVSVEKVLSQEGSISPAQNTDQAPADHQDEQRPRESEKDTGDPEGKTDDEV